MYDFMTKDRNDVDVLDKCDIKNAFANENLVYIGNTKHINEIQEEVKISPLLGAAILGLNNTGMPITNASNCGNLWTDIDAQEMYLDAKPTCYMILGKPGLGAYDLGEALSRKYSCVHLCPQNIILDEILQDSSTGKCLDFNMKHNAVCSHKTVLKILKRKIESAAVQHRGYVISGIPLVTAYTDPAYLIKSNHSETALACIEEFLNILIYNLKRKKPKTAKPTNSSTTSFIDGNLEEVEEEEGKLEEEEIPEEAQEEDVIAELPKYLLDTCCSVVFNIESYYETMQNIYLQQLEGLFNLRLKPDVIIYITCPDVDVVTKKSHKYINYKNNHKTVEPFTIKIDSDLRWPTPYNIKEYDNPHDVHVFNPKYNCRPPINFTKKSVQQLCNYRKCILPFIEMTIMEYNPKQVIKLDGRTSTYQMMHEITERLLLMHINPVIIPEPLYIEEIPDDFEEFWKKVEESNVIHSGVVKFRRYCSPWLNRCPVELKKRQSVTGKPKLAVTFLKHVYLMFSSNNFVSFCRNPRPYLKLQYLEPTCRIIVTGTKSSGKTMTAECLSWIFDTPVSSFEAFVEHKKEMKYQTYATTILSELIATIEDARFMEWQQKEFDRVGSLNEWNNSMLTVLKEYVPLLKTICTYKESEALRLKDEKIEKEEESIQEYEIEGMVETEQHLFVEELLVEEPDTETIANFNFCREKLSFLPILDSIEDCETALTDKSLIQYAPLHLITMVVKPQIPIFGDEDVTQAVTEYIVANDLQKEIDPTLEEIMEEISKFISDIDTDESYGKYIIDGFPSDPEYWEYLANAKLIPDYTIAIMESREIDSELISHYLNVESCIKNHQEVFASMKDPLIISKLQTKEFLDTTILNMKIIVNDLVNATLRSVINTEIEAENTDETGLSGELINSFTETIEKFRENWDGIKIKLEDLSKCYIEIELDNKSDFEVLEEILLKLRQCYFLKSEPNEDGEAVLEEEDDSLKDLLNYNFPQNLCEIGIYCPITYFNYGVLWEGKQEFSLKYDNKMHYFGKEEFLELFQSDVTKYQAYNKPFKKIPKLKVCITGCLGSGATELSKYIATELGLMHIDFKDFINLYYIPRHFKKVGRQYENPFNDVPMEEGVVEYQMDEENPNILADILANETELRHMVYNYYERGQPMIPIIMHKLIKRLWFNDIFLKTGFVLDGYPRLPQDVEDMVVCNCIPDLIINLDSNVETTLKRLSPVMFNQWKAQLKEAKEAHRIKMEDDHNEWMRFVTKNVVVRLIIEEVLDKIIEEDLPKTENMSNDSFIFDAHPLGALHIDPKLFSTYNEFILEYPEVKDVREWPKPEEMREEFNSRLEAIFESDYENIEAVKEIAMDNKIKSVTIDGTKSFYKVCRRTLAKLSALRNRCQSFFEQTFIVTTDIAELLLSQGYYFLSKFDRLCPVYIHENRQTIFNSYKISKRKDIIFPIIHRACIYFISSEEYVNKFRTDPLKYVTSDAIITFYTYPLRIGVIGAPKSGKSSLSINLARRNNLICISRGMALRHVLDNMYWTDLASKILKNLRDGHVINSDLIMSAVQTVALDHRTVTYGFVLDGFPSTSYEAMVLAKAGLYPNAIFDITSNKQTILHNSQNEVYFDIIKHKPQYSYTFMQNRFDAWQEQCYKVRQWIKNDYQNIYVLNGNESKWQCLQNANDKVKEIVSKIHYYLANANSNIVLASVMTISNDIFQEKQSGFKNMCPACIRKNVFRHSGYMGNKTGIVQYKNKLYWVCTDHLDSVLNYPEYYLSNEICIPELPAVVKIINTKNIYENGICIVTYAENLPAQKLERGINTFAATYKSKTYLFCNDTCLYKFLDKPHLYSDITVFKESSGFPRLSLNKLPNLGYLEQTVANILTEACCAANVVRPKYPGLSFQVSALIYIGLYLKAHNTLLPKEESFLYRKAFKRFEQQSKLILELGLRMRSMENPFNAYPKCPKLKSPSPLLSVRGEISSTGVRPSSIISTPGNPLNV